MSGRSETTRAVALEVRGFGISAAKCFDLMNAHWNRAGKCLPPWTDDELRREIAAAYAQGEAEEAVLARAPIQYLPHERRPVEFGTAILDEPEADRRFFERHPFRTHYVRRVFALEQRYFAKFNIKPPAGIPGRPVLFMAVEQVTPGNRIRSPFWGSSHFDTDVSNAEARTINDRIAPPGAEAYRETLRTSIREGEL